MSMNISYHVRPRYTPGSPAQIDRIAAYNVTQAEGFAYRAAMADVGTLDYQRACELGLAWIVWTSWEVYGHYHRQCKISGRQQKFKLPCPIPDPPLGGTP